MREIFLVVFTVPTEEKMTKITLLTFDQYCITSEVWMLRLPNVLYTHVLVPYYTSYINRFVFRTELRYYVEITRADRSLKSMDFMMSV